MVRLRCLVRGCPRKDVRSFPRVIADGQQGAVVLCEGHGKLLVRVEGATPEPSFVAWLAEQAKAFERPESEGHDEDARTHVEEVTAEKNLWMGDALRLQAAVAQAEKERDAAEARAGRLLEALESVGCVLYIESACLLENEPTPCAICAALAAARSTDTQEGA